MAKKKVYAEEYSFHQRLADALQSIENRCTADAHRIVDEVTASAVSLLHSAYPYGEGEYNKGWTSKKSFTDNVYTRTIYGKAPTYRLAHLLEHGHVTRNGKRVDGFAHIVPIEDWAIERIVQRMKEEL